MNKPTFSSYLLRLAKAPLSSRRYVILTPPHSGAVIIFDKSQKVFHRLHIESLVDYGTVMQIYLNQDYDLGGLQRYRELRKIYEVRQEGDRRNLILDCGANIGASGRYLSSAWPAAEIWAVEPSLRNIRLARQNLPAGSRVLHAAIGPRDGECAIVNPDAEPNAFRVHQDVPSSESHRIPMMSMRSILKEAHERSCVPFMLKMDIEGAESEVFESGCDWLHCWPVVMIELHDWMLPGRATSKSVLAAISNQARDVIIRGDTLVSIANSEA